MRTGKYKSIKLKYKDVVSLLEQCDCTFMWSEDKFNNEYVNNKKTQMEYKGKCGHVWMGTWSSVHRRLKPVSVLLRCACPSCNCPKKIAARRHKEHYNKETGEYQCSKCNEWKDYKTNFKKHKNSYDGRRNYCQECSTVSCKKMRKGWTEKEFIKKYLISNAKTRHNERVKKGIKYDEEFNITYEDIMELKEKQNNKCKYLGTELIWEVGSKNNQTSIDRIDSNKTYRKDNIQLVCFWANQAKNNDDEKEFLKRIVLAFSNM